MTHCKNILVLGSTKVRSIHKFLSPSSQLGLLYPHLFDSKFFWPQTSIFLLAIVSNPVIDWLDTEVGHQNSDRSSWNISSEFCGHPIFWLFKLEFLTKNFLVIWMVGQQNSDQNPLSISQEFCGHLIVWSEYYLLLGIFKINYKFIFHRLPMTNPNHQTH